MALPRAISALILLLRYQSASIISRLTVADQLLLTHPKTRCRARLITAIQWLSFQANQLSQALAKESLNRFPERRLRVASHLLRICIQPFRTLSGPLKSFRCAEVPVLRRNSHLLWQTGSLARHRLNSLGPPLLHFLKPAEMKHDRFQPIRSITLRSKVQNQLEEENGVQESVRRSLVPASEILMQMIQRCILEEAVDNVERPMAHSLCLPETR